MKKLKSWLSKLVRKQSPSPNFQCSIKVTVENDDQVFVESYFIDGNEERMGELLFLYSTGALTEKIVESLKINNKTDEQLHKILAHTQELCNRIQQTKETAVVNTAVVSPRHVFKHQEDNTS